MSEIKINRNVFEYQRSRILYLHELVNQLNEVSQKVDRIEYIHKFREETKAIKILSDENRKKKDQLYYIFTTELGKKFEGNEEYSYGNREFVYDELIANTDVEKEYFEFLAKVIIQLISPKQDFKCPYWQILNDFDKEDFVRFVSISFKNKYPWSYVREIVDKYYEWNQEYHWTNYSMLLRDYQCEVIKDNDYTAKVCMEVIGENEKIVEQIRSGKTAAMNSLKGMVMKKSNKKADIVEVGKFFETYFKI